VSSKRTRAQRWVTSLCAGSLYALPAFGVGFALGAVRILILLPRLKATASVLLEAPIILTVSWILSKVTTAWLHVQPDIGARALMGGTAFFVLMCAKFALSVTVFRKPASEFVLGFGTLPGAIGLAAQVVFGIFPLVQGRLEACGPQIFRGRDLTA